MKLLSFRAKNLFSLGEVDLDLGNRGLLLVTGYSVDEGGANGSGKSSLSNKGLLWTLFGATAGGEKADAVINRFRKEGEEIFGEVVVEPTSGGRFRIHRSRNPNRLLLNDLDTDKNISSTTEKDTQIIINHILGRNKETFLQTDFFGQGKTASFLDLTVKAQVELLENILPFERLQELHDKAKHYLGKVKTATQRYQDLVFETQGQLQECQRQERTISDSIDKWEQNQLKQVVSLVGQFEALQITEEKAARMQELDSLLSDFVDPMLNAKAITDAKFEIETLNAYVKTYKDIISNIDRDLLMLKSVPEPLNDTKCPTCLAPLSEIAIKKCRDEFSAYSFKKAQLVEAKNTTKEYLQTVEDGLQTQHTILADYHTAQQNFAAYTRELNELRAQVSDVRLLQLEEAIRDAKGASNPYASLYAENSDRTNLIMGHFNALKSKVDSINKDATALEFWVQAFSKDLKNELLKQVCPFLEQKSNIHLSALGNPQIKVRFLTTKTLKSTDEKSEFTVSVESSTGGGTYDSLSGGEKQMANFAVGMALADLAETQVDGPSKLAILDEPFMALDSRNSELVVNYLQTYLSNKKDTILLVSNEESLKQLIPNQIKVIKEYGITRLEQ